MTKIKSLMKVLGLCGSTLLGAYAMALTEFSQRCPDQATHFCRCETAESGSSSIYRVDITSAGQKFETLLRTYNNEEECNYQITRTEACKTRY